jgi:membrane protease YdiL (CAAX protease family)
MNAATGFQIAFLALAFEFFVMLASSWLAGALRWPSGHLDVLGQFVTIGLAIPVLLGIPALRRYCLEELRRPLPAGAHREIAVLAVAKPAIPFAVTGAIVLWAFASAEPSKVASLVPAVDPAKAWEWTTSPTGLARMVLLSWLLGPVVEELVFRGLLYRAWERQWGWVASTLLTSTVFAIAHPQSMVSAFLGSVVYICVLRRTGTLRASILVHMAFNFLVSWPLLGQYLLTAGAREASRLSSWTVELACLVAVAVALPAYLAMSRADARGAPAC